MLEVVQLVESMKDKLTERERKVIFGQDGIASRMTRTLTKNIIAKINPPTPRARSAPRLWLKTIPTSEIAANKSAHPRNHPDPWTNKPIAIPKRTAISRNPAKCG